MDHQRVAWDLIGIWYSHPKRERKLLDALRRMPRVDALLVVVRMVDDMDDISRKSFLSLLDDIAARRPDTISSIDCPHDRTLFIKSSTGGSPHRSEHVTVCAACGLFRVSAEDDGVRIVTTFDLPTWPLVEAAGRYAWHLEEEGKNGRVKES